MSAFAGLAARLSKLYALSVEPFVYGLRRAGRLQAFGLTVNSLLPTAHLLFSSARPCPNRPCQRLTARYAGYFCQFRRPPEYASQSRQGSGIAAVIDLDQFKDHQDFLSQLRKRSEFFYRKVKKARKLGYDSKIFVYKNRIPDICEIRKSLKFRAFGPVLDAFLLTVDAMGGAPVELQRVEAPPCPQHWEVFFGVFRAQTDHRQGDLAVADKLVAYARLHRIGNTVRYAAYMGHGEHMRHGVMMLLHADIVAWLQKPGDPATADVRFLTYGAIEQGSAGLFFWKRKALFRPYLLTFAPEPA